MDWDGEEPSIEVVIREDVRRLEVELANDIAGKEHETFIRVWVMFGKEFERRIERNASALVAGVPAPELEGWRFWAPRGNNGPLTVWARKAAAQHEEPSWHHVGRAADLAVLVRGELSPTRSTTSAPIYPGAELMGGFSAPSSDT